MPPLRIANRGGSRGAPVYYVTTVSQASILLLPGREPLRLLPDDFVVLSSDIPCDWQVGREYVTSTIHAEPDVFREHVPNHDELIGRRVNLPFNLGEVLRQTMESTWAIGCAGGFRDAGPKLVASFLEILSLMQVRGAFEERLPKTALDARRKQIKSFIRKSYARPDLSTEIIARELQITPRYLQMALASEGTTPSEYLKRYRLEASARRLRSSERGALSITEVALECGFNSSAYFSTEFKKAYGMTPRQYRAGGFIEPPVAESLSPD